MWISYVLYISVLLICWLCAYLANRYNNKGWVWLIIGLLTLLAGLRGPKVGMDTANYLRMFDLIEGGKGHLAYGLETTFKLIVYGIMRVIPDGQFLLLLFAFITNWLILIRFWELRKIASFTCMVVCYYMAFYFSTLNAARQFIAVGIVFYFTRYLAQKKMLRYVLGVLLAMLFHRTAVVGFALLAVNCLRWKELPKRQKLLYLFALLMAPVLIVLSLRMFSQYTRYFSNPSMDIGFMLLLKLAFLVATLIFVFVMHHGYRYLRNGHLLNSEDRYQIMITSLCYIMALFLTALGYIFDNAERIGLYYYIFEGVYFGMLLKGKKPLDRVILGYVIAFLLGSPFLYSMNHNSQGTMPYTFFW